MLADLTAQGAEVIRSLIDSVLAIVAGFLPVAWWQRWPSVQIRRFAVASAFVTMFAGFAIGVPGFLRYAERLGGIASAAIMSGSSDKTPQAFSALAPLLFALTTPLGLFSSYLVVSGFIRVLAGYVDDPCGDPLVSLVVRVATRSAHARRARSAAHDRLRREGAEVPDRLYSGEWANLPQADYVIVSSRRKPGWDAGVFVITSEKWYRLGVPFDMELPEGLRTVYPITALETVEVLRKGVPYELPPLSRQKRVNRT